MTPAVSGFRGRRPAKHIGLYCGGEFGRYDRAKITAALRAQCAKLASLPSTLGRARPELRRDLRSFPFRGYIILFRYVDDVFEVVNILEGHRDMDAFFADDEDE